MSYCDDVFFSDLWSRRLKGITKRQREAHGPSHYAALSWDVGSQKLLKRLLSFHLQRPAGWHGATGLTILVDQFRRETESKQTLEGQVQALRAEVQSLRAQVARIAPPASPRTEVDWPRALEATRAVLSDLAWNCTVERIGDTLTIRAAEDAVSSVVNGGFDFYSLLTERLGGTMAAAVELEFVYPPSRAR
jgi:hypothetical protein